MKNTILLAFVIAVAAMRIETGINATVPNVPHAGTEIINLANRAGFIDKLAPGFFREVTAYNVGRRNQTSGTPCIGATGENLCRLVAQGYRICAANFVATGTILNIEGYGMCVVLDRMNRRFSHRIDIAMNRDEVDRAIEFGVQRRFVEARPGYP